MSTAVLIPLLSPESSRVEIPDSMRPEDQARLEKQLGKISTEIATTRARDEERERFNAQRWRANDERIGKLEGRADASGKHDIAALQKIIDKQDTERGKLKWWALSIFATLATSGLVGLVVHYLAKG